MKDLVILAADKDLQHAMKGVHARPEALGIRAVEADIFVEPQHDPACARYGVEFIANFSRQYDHGLLMFDHRGSGMETISPMALQNKLNQKLAHSAWGERAKAIVLAPELEVWIWNDSPHIDEVAGWKNRNPSLRPWLIDNGWLQKGEVKPARPKEAFDQALRAARKPRSASLYEQIAKKVSLRRCKDASFLELKRLLSQWFRPEGQILLE